MRHIYILMAMAMLGLGAGNAFAEEVLVEVVTIANNESNMTIDAAFIIPPGPGSIGNYIWLDINRNGIQDLNETGISDVRVVLYYKFKEQLLWFGEQFTDGSGYYIFENLPTGTYQVNVDRSTVPRGLEPAIRHAPGSTVENDSG